MAHHSSEDWTRAPNLQESRRRAWTYREQQPVTYGGPASKQSQVWKASRLASTAG